MKATDRSILMILVAAALLIGFYLMVLSPKRDEAKKLGDEVEQLETAIAGQEQVVAFAEQARQDFPRYYGSMVVLGKAVPSGADSASMLVQLNSISNQAGTKFKGLTLGAGNQSAGAAAATATGNTPQTGSAPATGQPATESGASGGTTTTPSGSGTTPAPAIGSTPASAPAAAPATEAAAATLPIGATVGPAGLPTMPYDLFFLGTYGQVSEFISGVDDMVHVRTGSGQVSVDGRLLTIDGFSLKGGAPGSDPELEATFAMTSYVTPFDQSLTLGASPSGPASPAQTQVTQTSSPAVVP